MNISEFKSTFATAPYSFVGSYTPALLYFCGIHKLHGALVENYLQWNIKNYGANFLAGIVNYDNFTKTFFGIVQAGAYPKHCPTLEKFINLSENADIQFVHGWEF